MVESSSHMFTSDNMVLAADITQKIGIPEGVNVAIEGQKVSVSGPKGSLERQFSVTGVEIRKAGSGLEVVAHFPRRREKAMVGTVAAHIRNMVAGVTSGFRYEMQVYYSHFPMNVSIQGNKIVIKNFLGEKFPRESKIIGDTKVEISGQDVTVTGNNREHVGQTAANMEQATKIRRKDPRRFQDGIYIVKGGVADES